MPVPALKFKKPVIFLGPSKFSFEVLTEVLTYCDGLIAADGGAAAALALGLNPTAVIGDFDSLSSKTRDELDPSTLINVQEQQTTDFEKCLSRVDAPLVIAVGFSGGRLDHELAVLNALVAYPERQCIVIGDSDLVFNVASGLALDLPVGTRFSLFPMRKVTGKSKGLKWPIEGIDFAPGGMIGTSNSVVGSVHLELENPGILAILPRQFLGEVVKLFAG